MTVDVGFDSWFIHEKLVLSLLSTTEAAALTRSIRNDEADPFAAAARVDALEKAISTYLTIYEVEALDVQLLRGTLRSGQLVWMEQAIAFKGLGQALHRIELGGDGRATFSARVASNPAIRVRGNYNPTRITCNTARMELSGTRRHFMLGYVREATDDELEIRPVLIASRWLYPPPVTSEWYPADIAYLWPAAVDQFAAVDFSQRVTRPELSVLKDIPEADIKRAFAEIIGEAEVPSDWGGEQFDLWTTHLYVDKRPLRAAFLFKGPAEFRPMTIGSLGKNGDQIDRLAQTAADVLVLQHCHAITAPVVNMLRVYATDSRNPRRYLALDGYETIKLLRHFGYLSRLPKHKNTRDLRDNQRQPRARRSGPR